MSPQNPLPDDRPQLSLFTGDYDLLRKLLTPLTTLGITATALGAMLGVSLLLKTSSEKKDPIEKPQAKKVEASDDALCLPPGHKPDASALKSLRNSIKDEKQR